MRDFTNGVERFLMGLEITEFPQKKGVKIIHLSFYTKFDLHTSYPYMSCKDYVRRIHRHYLQHISQWSASTHYRHEFFTFRTDR